MEQKKIRIFTDGASKGNPGPGGWGAIIASGELVVELGGHERHTTNNRMEMKAALEALSYARKLPAIPVVINTDSSYVINGITKWVRGWKARGWMTSQKKEVLNRDLWKELSNIVEKFGDGIEWNYVGGHIGIPGNERADEIASDFALGKKVNLHSGARGGYGVDVHTVVHDSAKHKAKSSLRTRSKQKAYSYVSEVGGAVKVHTTWAECEERVRGKQARFKKALSPADEARIVKAFSMK